VDPQSRRRGGAIIGAQHAVVLRATIASTAQLHNRLMQPIVVHAPALGRFETTVDGHLCTCQYRLYGGRLMMLTHTGVPGELRGRGIAAALVQAALDHARAKGWKVRPDCSYAEAYMQRHPQTLDLLPE
jgi:uncharacterized protein